MKRHFGKEDLDALILILGYVVLLLAIAILIYKIILMEQLIRRLLNVVIYPSIMLAPQNIC